MFGLRSKKQHNFERVSGEEDHEHLLADGERSPLGSQPSGRNARGPSWLAAVIIVVCTAVLSAALGAFVTQYERLDADGFSIRHSSQYCRFEKCRDLLLRANRFSTDRKRRGRDVQPSEVSRLAFGVE
jgi:hypothetical protein